MSTSLPFLTCMSDTMPMPESGVTSWLDSLEQYGGGFPTPGIWLEPGVPSWRTKLRPLWLFPGAVIEADGGPAAAAAYRILSIVLAKSVRPALIPFPWGWWKLWAWKLKGTPEPGPPPRFPLKFGIEPICSIVWAKGGHTVSAIQTRYKRVR